MGVVYKAHDTRLNRVVALKFLPGHIADNPIERKRFRHEAQAAATLNHPNIAQVYAIEEDEEELFIVMEFVEGEELKEAIDAGRFSLSEQCRLAEQIARGLKAAHDKQVIHRDIKTRNIMIDLEGNARIMDFGLARVLGTDHITRTGTTLGTTAYMAPEQLRGEEMDRCSDIWAFGVVLYELFTGRLPFNGLYESAVMYAINEEEPPIPSSLNPEIPNYVEKVILKCLSKDKVARYQDMDELLAGLNGQAEPIRSAKPPGQRKRLKHALFFIGIPTLLLILLFVGTRIYPSVLRGHIPAKRYLAVLPIENIGSDPALRAICDGLAETFSYKLSTLERYQNYFWVAPSSELRRENIVSATQANKQLGVNLVVISSLQVVSDSTRLTLQLVDTRRMHNLETQQVVVPAGNLAVLEQRGVRAVLKMLDIETNPMMVKTLQAGEPRVSGSYAFYLKGRAALQSYSTSDSLESAIRYFQRAVEIDPDFALAYAGLGESYWRKFETTRSLGLAQMAESSLNKALDINTELAPVQSLLGLLNAGTGDYTGAVTHFNEALKIDPGYVPAYRGLANIYDARQEPQKAEETFRHAIALNPDLWIGYRDLGNHYKRTGNFEEAIQQFHKVLRLTPESGSAYSNLGVAYYLNGQRTEARTMFEKALAINNDPITANNLAAIYYLKGQYGKSAAMYEKALSAYADRYDFWANMASVFELSGQHNKAMKYYRKAIDLAKQQLDINPRDAEVMADLGAYYSDTGDSASARQYIEKALHLDRDNSWVRQRAVSTYEKLGLRKYALQWITPSMIPDLETQPELKNLTADPRFLALKAGYKTEIPQ